VRCNASFERGNELTKLVSAKGATSVAACANAREYEHLDSKR